MRCQKYKHLFWSVICAAFFSVLMIPSLLDSNLFTDLTIQISYDVQEDGAIDRLLISRMIHSGVSLEHVPLEQIEYDDEKERWEIPGNESGVFQFKIRSWQFLTFMVEYRLTSQDAVLTDEAFDVSVFQNGQLIQSDKYSIGHVYDVRQKFIYCRDGAKAICLFIAVWIIWLCICWSAGRWAAREKFNSLRNRIDLECFFLMIFAVTCFMFLNYAAPINGYVNDTASYCANSVSEFSWYNRMPVYQFLLLVVRKILNASDWETVFPVIVFIQRAFSIVGIVAFYSALKKICRNRTIAIVFSYLYAMAVSIWGYAEYILTESLAVSLMCVLIWLIVKIIDTHKRIYIVLCSVLTVVAILERPSFLFLLPVIGIFFFVMGFYIQNKEILCWGLGSVVICTLLILGYCRHNEQLTGQFMLCCVTYHNQGANLLKGNMFVNEQYPDITKESITRAQQPQSSLADAIDLCRMFGYNRIADYQKSCRKLYFKEYVYYLLETNVLDWLDKPIVEERMIEDICLKGILETVRLLAIPYNFAMLIMVSLAEFAYGVFLFIRDKRLEFLSFGIPGCIWAILITSMISLEDDALPRLTICIIPLAVILTAMVLEQFAGWYYCERNLETEMNQGEQEHF